VTLRKVKIATSPAAHAVKTFTNLHKFWCFYAFYARKQLLLSARLSHRNSVCPSVRLRYMYVDQSKTVQVRITKSLP